MISHQIDRNGAKKARKALIGVLQRNKELRAVLVDCIERIFQALEKLPEDSEIRQDIFDALDLLSEVLEFEEDENGKW